MQNSCYLIPFSHELFKAFLYLYRKQIWQKSISCWMRVAGTEVITLQSSNFY